MSQTDIISIEKEIFAMNQEQGIYLFHQGTNFSAYKLLGSHFYNDGVIFRVWAPNAKKVAVVGDFNCWDRYKNVMIKITEEGLWEVFIPGVKECVHTYDGLLTIGIQ